MQDVDQSTEVPYANVSKTISATPTLPAVQSACRTPSVQGTLLAYRIDAKIHVQESVDTVPSAMLSTIRQHVRAPKEWLVMLSSSVPGNKWNHYPPIHAIHRHVD